MAGLQLEPDPFALARARMVETQIAARGITDPLVLEAMRAVPRHLFVPPELAASAHDDGPLAIGHGQTISQPFIVALMTELAGAGPGVRVLEVGCGSGYQTAVLAATGCEVFAVEIVPELAEAARERLGHVPVPDVAFGGQSDPARGAGPARPRHEPRIRTGDGTHGWPEEAPFDACLVAAAPAGVPPALLEQLRIGGRLVIPLGVESQWLAVLTRTAQGYDRRDVCSVRFVPMTGLAAGG